MDPTPGDKPLRPSELAWLGLLGVLVAIGLAGNGLTAGESLVAVAFLAAAFGLAWLWQLTLRRAETAPPLTRGQRAWNAAVFVAFVVALAAIVWWHWR